MKRRNSEVWHVGEPYKQKKCSLFTVAVASVAKPTNENARHRCGCRCLRLRAARTARLSRAISWGAQQKLRQANFPRRDEPISTVATHERGHLASVARQRNRQGGRLGRKRARRYFPTLASVASSPAPFDGSYSPLARQSTAPSGLTSSTAIAFSDAIASDWLNGPLSM